MPPTIVFETHSTSLDNEAGLASGHYDVALSPLGELQARQLGERLASERIDIVFCSDLGRARRTARQAFAPRGISIVADARLREVGYGALTRSPRARFPAARATASPSSEPGASWTRWGRDSSMIASSVIGHFATHLAFQHLLCGRPLEEVLAEPYAWQPRWEYRYTR